MVLALLSGAHRPTAPGGCSRVPAGPRTAPLTAGYPRPAGPSIAKRRLRQAGASRSVDFVVRGPPIGVGCARGVWSLAGRGGSSQFRLVSVSAVSLASASWGVVRLGGRRLRACRCSRGRRPSGSDSEATGSPRSTSSTTPERGRRSIDSDSVTTRLPTLKAMLTSRLVCASEDSRRQSSATTTKARFDRSNAA